MQSTQSGSRAMTENVRAAIYTRVSTDEQAKEGHSLGDQEHACQAHIERHGWRHVETYSDEGYSGDDPNRPAHKRMLADVAGSKLDAIVVRALDRFGRDAWAIEGTLRFFDESGVRLESTRETIDRKTPEGTLQTGILAQFGQFEKAKIKARTRAGLAARARAGGLSGGPRPYGYDRVNKSLMIVPHEAEVVRRMFEDSINGMSQRMISRALTDEGVPTARGGVWASSNVGAILANPLYRGCFMFNGETLKGTHEAIVSEDVWARAELVRSSKVRRGGRWPDGGHLLVKGVLVCGQCGYAMIPRKIFGNGGRERYQCRGRMERGKSFCDQPSIRRELIDGPFLDALTTHYIDLEATQARIEARTASDLTIAREAVIQAETEVQRTEARLAKIQRGWQDEVIDDNEYRQQRDQLLAEQEGAQAALQRAQDHVAKTERTGVMGDAQQALLRHLATIKEAVADGVGRAPDLNALRNVIGTLFEKIELVRWGSWGIDGDPGGWMAPVEQPAVVDRDQGYALWLTLRWSAVDLDSEARPFTGIRKTELPLPSSDHDTLLCL